MDLAEILDDREIVHPSVVQSVSCVARGRIQFEVEGLPWWRPDTLHRKGVGRLSVEISGVSEASLPFDGLGWDDEALEGFSIYRTENVAELTGPYCNLYSNTPIPDPAAVVAVVDELTTRTIAPLSIAGILNRGRSLRDFFQYASKPSALIARGFKGALTSVQQELDRQHVRYTLLETAANDVPPLLIRFLGGYAYAEKITGIEVGE